MTIPPTICSRRWSRPRSTAIGLTDQEIGSFIVLLGVAGNDTTRNSITHGVHGLRRAPRAVGTPAERPRALAAGAVEEILRWASPVMTFRRTATTDTTVGDQPIAEGDHVVMFYALGQPRRAGLRRPVEVRHHPPTAGHVAFGGGGPHYCLGANLARTAAPFGVRGARQVGQGIRGRTNRSSSSSAFVHGINSMDCTFILD